MSERPLPQNRRVAKPKEAKAVVEAPSEVSGLEEVEPTRRDPSRVFEVARTALGLLFALGISIGCVYVLVHYTHTSPRFGVRTFHVTGMAQRTAEAIVEQGGMREGDNIFALDLDRAQAKILEDPYIETVTIARKLPTTLLIEVTEREAAALVAMGGSLYLATREGEVFKKVEPTDPFDLPIVTGIDPDRVATDRAGVTTAVRRALDLAGEYERLGSAKRFPLQEIHASEDGTLSLVVGKSGLVLRLGKGPYRQALDQASRVLNEVTSRRAQAKVIFLDNEAHPERVVVRMK